MHSLVSYWKRYLSSEELEDRVLWFCKASEDDKCACISDTYGIFDATMKDGIYTYYFYDCDTLDYKYHGKKNWYKGADIFRVDYDVMADKTVVTKCSRFNRRCTENRYRMI